MVSVRKYIVLTFLILLISGCSTIDRQVYYQPDVDASLRRGPDRLFCGFAQFGGAPDEYISLEENAKFSVTSYQNFHPYFFGPWFVSVVPVFPITWVTELFVSDNIDVRVMCKEEEFCEKEFGGFSISYVDGDKSTTIFPSLVEKSGRHFLNLKFPVDYTKIDRFTFNLKVHDKEFHIPFSKTSRWSWTQITPNC